MTSTQVTHPARTAPARDAAVEARARAAWRLRRLICSGATILALCAAFGGCMTYTTQDEERVRALGLPLLLKLEDDRSPSGLLNEIWLGIANVSGEQIKYVEVEFRWYNRFGDEVTVACESCGRVHARAYRVTDPFGPDDRAAYYSYDGADLRDAWETHKVSCVELTKIMIIRVDGTTASFGQQQIDAMLISGPQRRCVAGER